MEKKERLTGQACFHSQLAAEKAIKAGLVFLKVKFPLDHNLKRLSSLYPKDWAAMLQKSNLTLLSNWAVDSRYYNTANKPSVGQAQEAYQQAKTVVAAIEQFLEKAGVSL